MCYSALIKVQLREIAAEFRAATNLAGFEDIFRARLQDPHDRVPLGLDRYFLLSRDPAEAKLAPLVKAFHEQERQRAQLDVKLLEAEIASLRAQTTAAARKKREAKERKREKLVAKAGASIENVSPSDDRIFPFYWAPVVAEGKKGRVLTPMRYRFRAPDGGEVPGKYNVFNARRDSLESARTWRGHFGRHHALFPFRRFYEWVERDGEKKEIYFTPENRQLMWAAALFLPDKSGRQPSFAMVTDEPPPEIARAGHDRCPIFLRQDQIAPWLLPLTQDANSLEQVLNRKENAFYLSDLAS